MGDHAIANYMNCHTWLANVLGWIMTALAISLGEPFGFDLFNELVQQRGTGPNLEAMG